MSPVNITLFYILFVWSIDVRLTKASLWAQAKSIHSMFWLVKIWQVSLCGKFMQHLETCLLIAEADRVLYHLVMVLTVFFHWMYNMKYSCYQGYFTIYGWSVNWLLTCMVSALVGELLELHFHQSLSHIFTWKCSNASELICIRTEYFWFSLLCTAWFHSISSL